MNKYGDRRAVGTVGEIHGDNGIFGAVNGLYKFKESFLFLKARVPAVVKYHGDKSALLYEPKSLFHRFNAGVLHGVYGVVAAGEPAEVKGDAGDCAILRIAVHLCVAAEDKLRTV